jgi:hypothetical protein
MDAVNDPSRMGERRCDDCRIPLYRNVPFCSFCYEKHAKEMTERMSQLDLLDQKYIGQLEHKNLEMTCRIYHLEDELQKYRANAYMDELEVLRGHVQFLTLRIHGYEEANKHHYPKMERIEGLLVEEREQHNKDAIKIGLLQRELLGCKEYIREQDQKVKQLESEAKWNEDIKVQRDQELSCMEHELKGLRNVRHHFWNYEGDPKQNPGHNFQHWITLWEKPENWNR